MIPVYIAHSPNAAVLLNSRKCQPINPTTPVKYHMSIPKVQSKLSAKSLGTMSLFLHCTHVGNCFTAWFLYEMLKQLGYSSMFINTYCNGTNGVVVKRFHCNELRIILETITKDICLCGMCLMCVCDGCVL